MIKADVTSKAYNDWISHIIELVKETNFFVIKENIRGETSTQLSVYFPENEYFKIKEPFMSCSEYSDNTINVIPLCQRSVLPRFLGGTSIYYSYYQCPIITELHLNGTDKEFKDYLNEQIKFYKEGELYFKTLKINQEFKDTNTWKKQIEGTYNAV